MFRSGPVASACAIAGWWSLFAEGARGCDVVPDEVQGVSMRTLMTGPAWVSYGQIYVESSERQPEMPECFGGQRNGLCGAAVAGALFLGTGLHTGEVGFAVELYDEAPPVDDSWEEIVEASYRPIGEVALVGWGGEGYWPLGLDAIDYRVRYCGLGMDAGHHTPPMDGEPPVDRYLLQFWPAPPEPDQVIKQTSTKAAYWHSEARKTPPPPTPEQRAEMQREREGRRVEEKPVPLQTAADDLLRP